MIDVRNLKMLRHKILVQRLGGHKAKHGIIISNRDRRVREEGIILKVGDDTSKNPTPVVIGDVICFKKFTGKAIAIDIMPDGRSVDVETFLVMDFEDVIAVYNEPPELNLDDDRGGKII